jgi:hypothetical protein
MISFGCWSWYRTKETSQSNISYCVIIACRGHDLHWASLRVILTTKEDVPAMQREYDVVFREQGASHFGQNFGFLMRFPFALMILLPRLLYILATVDEHQCASQACIRTRNMVCRHGNPGR